MPGLLSNIFEDEGSGGNGAQSSHSSSSDGGAEAHFDPSVNVHAEVGASWENPDGSHSEYSQSLDVTLTTDTAIGAAGNFDESQFQG